MKSVLLISHGSRSPKTKQEVAELVEKIQKHNEGLIVHFAFLELEEPNIPDGITQCINDGADEVLVLLNFLNSGRHVDEDIPMIVQQAQKKYPDVRITISKPVGQHERIAELFQEYI